ncbi:MAG: zinc-dependent peptidase [Phycisphaerales bacterium]|nr:zinc-dependent peptidase [Phycisphaerales bacterium]
MLGLKRKRRQRLRQRPFPEQWRKIVERNMPQYTMLAGDDQRELQGLIHIFLHEKRFEGCGGLTITDEIRITIAAYACLLLLHRDTDNYPLLRSILVYPGDYVVHEAEEQPDGTVIEETDERHGESWDDGAIVLSWDEVRQATDGWNIVLHEFAHQLDAESGETDGAPMLSDRSMYDTWPRVFSTAYKQLIDDVKRDRPTLLDPYGAEEPAEFFAVVTEAFFEQPIDLRGHHPELYEQMMRFYQQDPAAWNRTSP